jgi:hypothetical protein
MGCWPVPILRRREDSADGAVERVHRASHAHALAIASRSALSRPCALCAYSLDSQAAANTRRRCCWPGFRLACPRAWLLALWLAEALARLVAGSGLRARGRARVRMQCFACVPPPRLRGRLRTCACGIAGRRVHPSSLAILRKVSFPLPFPAPVELLEACFHTYSLLGCSLAAAWLVAESWMRSEKNCYGVRAVPGTRVSEGARALPRTRAKHVEMWIEREHSGTAA